MNILVLSCEHNCVCNTKSTKHLETFGRATWAGEYSNCVLHVSTLSPTGPRFFIWLLVISPLCGPDHPQSLFYFTPQTIARIFTVCDQSLTIAHLQFSPNAYGGNFPDFSHLLKAKFRKGSFPFRTFWFFFNLVVVRLDPFSFQTQELFAMVTSFISVAATVLLVFPLNSSAHRWTQVNGMRWDLRVRQSDKNMF